MESLNPTLTGLHRPKRRALRATAAVAGLLVLASLALLVLKSGTRQAEANGAVPAAEEGGEKEKAAIPVEVAAVRTGPVSSYISATANLVAENEVKILAEAEGRVATLRVEEGDWVEKGEELATLVRDDSEIALKKAQLKEREERLAYERARGLMERELISREAFDNTTIEFEMAGQELAEAEWRMRKTSIQAPFSGRLSGRYIQLGKHVRLGDELFQITDLDPLVARIYLPERDVLGLRLANEVRISLNADPAVRLAGRIRQISPVVDTQTGTVKLTLEAQSGHELVRPGSFVTVYLVRETRAEAILLPRDAVVHELKQTYIFLAEDDRAVKRQVILGLEEGEWVEAVSGVESGERVVVAGQGDLEAGAAIKILTDA